MTKSKSDFKFSEGDVDRIIQNFEHPSEEMKKQLKKWAGIEKSLRPKTRNGERIIK